MKFELQKTWDVSRRLITWEKNSHAFDKKPKEQEAIVTGINWNPK
jgi:ATP:corrinoid adenosyltransferase